MDRDEEYRNLELGKIDPTEANPETLQKIKKDSTSGSNAWHRAEDGLRRQNERASSRWQRISLVVAILGLGVTVFAQWGKALKTWTLDPLSK